MGLKQVSPESIIAFFVQHGSQTVQTESCWWYNEYGQRWLFSFPLHRLVQPTTHEIGQLFRQMPGMLGARYIAPPDHSGKSSFIWVRRGPYDLVHLSANTRSKVRRGLARCQVHPIGWDELIPLAMEAQRDTLQRHGANVSKPISLGINSWLHECPAYEAWGAFIEGQLAAYLITLSVEDCVHLLINRSANAFLKFYPNNALIFTAVQEALARPSVTMVSYGWESLSSLESLDDFKQNMGFFRQPVSQHVIINPWIRPLLQPILCRTIVRAMLSISDNARVQRLAGLLDIISQSKEISR
jgi:hypothetical protein